MRNELFLWMLYAVFILGTVSVLAELKQLSTGGNSACSLGCNGNGQLGCWGDNFFSQFGTSDGRKYIAAATPPQTGGAVQSAILQVGVGDRHWCALLDSNKVFCQGDNSRGQLGKGTNDASVKSNFVQVPDIKTLYTGGSTNCLLLQNSSLVCWGGDSLSPVPTFMDLLGSSITKGASVSSALQGVVVSFSNGTTSVLLRGNNQFGQARSPLSNLVANFTTLSSPGMDFANIAVGPGGHSCATLSNGRLACFGNNDRGQLGLGFTNSSGVPVPPTIVPNVQDVDKVALGKDFTCFTTQATAGAKLFCFGANEFGQLGTGDQQDHLAPGEVTFGEGISIVSNIFLGDSHVFVTMEGGSVFAWGRNDLQQLGFGSDTFPVNATKPHLHEALTKCNQKNTSIPTGFTVMLSLLLATLIVAIIFQISEWQRKSLSHEKGNARTLQNQIKELIRGKVDRNLLQTFSISLPFFMENDYEEYFSINQATKEELWERYLNLLAMKTANEYTQTTRGDSKHDIERAVWYVGVILMGLVVEGPRERSDTSATSMADASMGASSANPEQTLKQDAEKQLLDLEELRKVINIVEEMINMAPTNRNNNKNQLGRGQRLTEVRTRIAQLACLDTKPIIFADLACPVEPLDLGMLGAGVPIPEDEEVNNGHASATTEDLVNERRQQIAKKKQSRRGQARGDAEESSELDDNSTVPDEDDASLSYVSDGPGIGGSGKLAVANTNKRKQQPPQMPPRAGTNDDASTVLSSQSGNGSIIQNKNRTLGYHNADPSATTPRVRTPTTPKYSRLRSPTIRNVLDESSPRSTVWGFSGYRFLRAEKRFMASVPLPMKEAGAKLITMGDTRRNDADPKKRPRCARAKEVIVEFFKTYFGRFRTHPGFYLWNFAMIAAIFSFFAFQNPKKTESALFSLRQTQADRPGGFGVTFLPFPPYYDFTQPEQNQWIPVLYGVMHCNLFFFAMLIVPFWRRFWQTIVDRWPNSRHYLPLDDLIFVHRFYAWLFLLGLVIGCIIFVAVMGEGCADGQFVACTAFSLADPSPISNVFALRITVWCTVFPVMPLMYVVRRGPPSFLPTPLAQYWYEICYVLHVIIAVVVAILALVARFQVFYPILISWIPFVLDFIWDSLRHTYKFKIIRIQGYGPDPVNNPKSFSVKIDVKGKHKFQAGQYVWIRVNAVEKFGVAHPFSIASAKQSDTLDLHIGCIKGPGHTWTSRLYSKWMSQLKPGMTPSLDVQVRGPFGCAFSSCFDPKWGCCMVIGAGTGLTAAESVLRQKILDAIANKGKAPNQLFWFVWSTRSVDDLLMVWEVLIEAFMQGIKGGVLDIEALGALDGNILDWIGVTLFVTDFRSNDMQEFNHYLKTEYRYHMDQAMHPGDQEDRGSDDGAAAPLPSFATLGKQQKGDDVHRGGAAVDANPDEDPEAMNIAQANDSEAFKDLILRYRLSKFLMRQIIQGSMDERRTHIKHLLVHVKKILNLHAAKRTNMCVSFCGPSSVADVIHNAVMDVCATDEVEFSMDQQ